MTETQQQSEQTVGIARAAMIIGAGNVASRLLGLVREQIKAGFFGAGALVDAFTIATLLPRNLHDLLIGGMIDSALVPVFSDLADLDRDELWRLVSSLLSLTVVVLAGFVIAAEVFAPQAIQLLALLTGTELPAEFIQLAAQLLRITTPAVIFLSLSGVLAALLYALKRFTLPAFIVAVFNGSIVVVTILLQSRMSISAMALGWLVGAVMQVALLLPGLRGTSIMPTLCLWHPALKRISTLYIPILAGLAVEIIFIRPLTYGLALETGVGGLSWLNYATNISQLPQGLVGIAISFAILPTLSQHAAAANRGDEQAQDDFRSTLAQGLSLALLLMIPAAVGLGLLGRPTIDLILEQGQFTPFDTLMTTIALDFYLIGLPFAAVDLLLVFAFYARQNTLTPALIGVFTNLAYAPIAVLLVGPLGLFGLMLANSLKLLWHAAISAFLLRREIGSLRAFNIRRTIGISAIAVSLMAVGVLASLWGLQRVLPASDQIWVEALLVGIPGVVGMVIYFAVASRLGSPELAALTESVRRRLGLLDEGDIS